jgi:phosphotriesterase-related protein
MAHSRPASETGPRQIEVFEEEGVDLGRVQIAHTGDTDDLDYIERVLEKGVFIGLDRYGLEMFLPTDRRNATFAELLRRGYADRIFVSQDFCATIDWFPAEAVQALVEQGGVRDWSMTLVFDEVLPALREQGAISDEQIETIFVDNPRRWLVG